MEGEDGSQGRKRSVLEVGFWNRDGGWKDRWFGGAVKGFRGGIHFGDQWWVGEAREGWRGSLEVRDSRPEVCLAGGFWGAETDLGWLVQRVRPLWGCGEFSVIPGGVLAGLGL